MWTKYRWTFLLVQMGKACTNVCPQVNENLLTFEWTRFLAVKKSFLVRCKNQWISLVEFFTFWLKNAFVKHGLRSIKQCHLPGSSDKDCIWRTGRTEHFDMETKSHLDRLNSDPLYPNDNGYSVHLRFLVDQILDSPKDHQTSYNVPSVSGLLRKEFNKRSGVCIPLPEIKSYFKIRKFWSIIHTST